MKVKQLLEILQLLDKNAELEISVDISTCEDDAMLRVFATELIDYQMPGTILMAGYSNNDKN